MVGSLFPACTSTVPGTRTGTYVPASVFDEIGFESSPTYVDFKYIVREIRGD
jgi:hypothetical protein